MPQLRGLRPDSRLPVFGTRPSGRRPPRAHRPIAGALAGPRDQDQPGITPRAHGRRLARPGPARDLRQRGHGWAGRRGDVGPGRAESGGLRGNGDHSPPPGRHAPAIRCASYGGGRRDSPTQPGRPPATEREEGSCAGADTTRHGNGRRTAQMAADKWLRVRKFRSADDGHPAGRSAALSPGRLPETRQAPASARPRERRAGGASALVDPQRLM
jgi:hypothetical protein